MPESPIKERDILALDAILADSLSEEAIGRIEEMRDDVAVELALEVYAEKGWPLPKAAPPPGGPWLRTMKVS